jgi:hypothetical protein
MLGKLTILSFKAIDKRLNSFVESHNNINTTLSTEIRISRKSALRNVVNAYRNYIYDFRNNSNWETKTDVPEMPINRKIISKMVGCADRTAYNHIQFLINAGVLIKKLHGRQNNFGLFLNPYFWLSEAETLPNVVMGSKTNEPLFSMELCRFLPPISIQEFQEINNYYKEGVENVDKVSWGITQTKPPHFQLIKSDDISRKSSEQSGFSEKNITNTENLEKNKISASGADLSTLLGGKLAQVVKNLEKQDKSNGTKTVGGNESLITSEVPPQSLPYSQNEAEAWQLVSKFTDYALVNIYESNEFNKNFFVSPSQYSEIKNLVMSDVFGNFQNATNDIDRIRQQYTDAILAIDKAIKFAKNRNWSSFLHPKCYFSKSFFNSGKRGTFFEAFKWQVEDKQKLQGIKIDEYIQKAKHCVQFEKSPRGRKDLTTRLQISIYYRKMIAKKCGAFNVSIFNTWLSTTKF